MSNCYKNFPVIINYSNATSDTIYSNSTSLSENLNLETSSSIGARDPMLFLVMLSQKDR